MTQRFESRTALITGGTSGIGYSTALAFAREGANVVIAARSDQNGEKVAAELKQMGVGAMFIRTDVTSDKDVEHLVAKTVAEFGKLDIAFNNAGYGGMTVPCADFLESHWDQTIAVNLKGVWLCMKHQIRAMLASGGGVIVNNSSAAGLNGGPATGVAYCASKHGVVGLTKAAAAEYAAKGVRINCICPGVVGTPMANESFDGSAEQPEIVKRHPIGRIGRPDEIADAVLFLSSTESSFLIGAAIPVDGGLTLDN